MKRILGFKLLFLLVFCCISNFAYSKELAPQHVLVKACASEYRKDFIETTKDDRYDLAQKIQSFAAEKYVHQKIVELGPDFYTYNTKIVVGYLATLPAEELPKTLSIICKADWGITDGHIRESIFQTASGAVFFTGFVISLSVSPTIALPVFITSSGLGAIGFALKGMRKWQETEAENTLFDLSNRDLLMKRVGAVSNFVLAGMYAGLTVSANSFIQPFHPKGVNYTTRGWKLILPIFDKPEARSLFYVVNIMRTATTAAKIAEYEGNPFLQPMFYTDAIVNYFLGLLIANYGDVIGSGNAIMGGLKQVLFNGGAMFLIDNWSSNLQQLMGYRYDERYRDFLGQWLLSGYLLTRIPVIPLHTEIMKMKDPLIKNLAFLSAILAIEVPKNSVFSAAMARYAYKEQNFFDAFKNSKIADFLPWSAKKGRKLEKAEVYDMIQDWNSSN